LKRSDKLTIDNIIHRTTLMQLSSFIFDISNIYKKISNRGNCWFWL